MTYVRMHVRNKERAFRKLRAMDGLLETELAKASLKSAEEVANLASSLAPKNPATPSEYHRTINARQLLHVDRKYQGQTYMSRAVGAAGVFASWRWHFVEYGTVNNPPYPHLMPAYRSLRKKINGRLRRAISRAAKRIRER